MEEKDKKNKEQEISPVPGTIKAVALVPIFFKGERKEAGETVEVTAEEMSEMKGLVTEEKE